MPMLYVERVASINGITVLADDAGLDESKRVLQGDMGVNEEKNIESVLQGFEDIMDGSVEYYNGGAVKLRMVQSL